MGYLEEMAEQADVLEALVQSALDQIHGTDLDHLKRFRRVLLTGMGSSYFAGWYGAILLNRCGITAYALEAGEMEREFLPGLTEEVLLVAISQSGESPETLRCLEKIKGKNVLGITNRVDSSLSQLCEYGVVDILAGTEETSATKSYTNTLGALLRLVMNVWNYRITGLDVGISTCLTYMRTWLQTGCELRKQLYQFFEDSDQIVFLGSGLSLASAWQAALLFGEMTHHMTTALSVGQFFHGLIEQITEHYGAVFFHSNETPDHHFSRAVEAFLKEGGRVALVGSGETLHRWSHHERCLGLSHGVHNEELACLVEILPAQYLAYELGVKAGLTPGVLSRVQKIH